MRLQHAPTVVWCAVCGAVIYPVLFVVFWIGMRLDMGMGMRMGVDEVKMGWGIDNLSTDRECRDLVQIAILVQKVLICRSNIE